MKQQFAKEQKINLGIIAARSNKDLKVEVSKKFPELIYLLFFIFAVYLVLPIVDVPLLGLSISAPIMFMIAIPCFFKPPRPWFHKYRLWIFLGVAIWTGIFISTIGNGIESSGADINRQGIITLIRYLYWLIVFVITVYFASQKWVMEKVTRILGWAVFVLAIFRLGEAIILGNYGGYRVTRLISPNAYGFLFSMFSPFLLLMIFQKRGWKRFYAVIANMALWGAVAINGSRGSWISIGLGLALTLSLFFFSSPKKFSGMIFFVILAIGLLSILWVALPQVSSAIQGRFESFQSLDQDKSVLIRELMIQKGLRLFKENPLIGVGADRFTKETILLPLPQALTYESQSYFNARSSHNSYIQFLAEFGLAGSAPLAIMLVINVALGSKLAFNSLKKEDVIPLSVFLSFFQMSAHMFVISSITNTSNWFIYGLVGAVIMAYRESQE